MEQVQLRSDLQRVLEQFSSLKVDYCKSKINLKARDEIIELQKTNMEAVNKRVDMIANALQNYQRKCQENLLKYQGENYQLTQRIQELEDRCRNLQQTNQDLVVEGNSVDNKRVEMLEDEVQILESRVAAMEQQHREEIDKLRADYEEQISDKLRVIEELNEKIKKMTQQMIVKRPFVHPALYEEVNKVKNYPVVKKKTPNSAFKWPDLEVEKIPQTPDPTPPPMKKKKKLFNNDDDEIVDLIG